VIAGNHASSLPLDREERIPGCFDRARDVVKEARAGQLCSWALQALN